MWQLRSLLVFFMLFCCGMPVVELHAWWILVTILASMLELLPRPLPCAVFFLWSVMLICVAVTTAYNAPIGIKYKPEAFVVSLRSAHGKF